MKNQAVQIGLGVLCFLIALLLVIAIVRLLLGGRLRMPGGRTRQARLGIVDAFDLDRQRQLIIVRRDNTEHLIMIGGPNDILIESEIVRVEASRDLRGRERPDAVVAPGADRIPAPAGLDRDQVAAINAPRPEEPLLPMSLPEATGAVAAAPEPSRGPTFPLPPRRPAGPPPRLPDAVMRDVPPPGAVPPPLPVGPGPIPPSLDADLSGPAPSVAPQLAPAPALPPGQTRPPFLKPLPPRPPIRPLTRVTPKAPGVGPQDPPMGASPASAAPPSLPQPLVPPPMVSPPLAPPPPPPPAATSLPPAKSADEPNDALDSLEEEMAKLLGRG